MKLLLALLLSPLAWLVTRLGPRLSALWAHARLRQALQGRLHPTAVVRGCVAVEGTGKVQIGRHALIYPGVVLETQGAGRIEIGDHVVISRGVHIVAFEHITIGDHCMLGEYTSVRDANHRRSTRPMRDSGHDSAPIHLETNVWVGRGACVLAGVHVGAHSIVGANAVLTRSLPAGSVATGVPALAHPVPAPL